jgi:hypothetical protein
LKRYRKGVRKIFGFDSTKHLGGNEYFSQSPASFQQWLNGIYGENNRNLKQLLQYYYQNSSMNTYSLDDAGWSL